MQRGQQAKPSSALHQTHGLGIATTGLAPLSFEPLVSPTAPGSTIHDRAASAASTIPGGSPHDQIRRSSSAASVLPAKTPAHKFILPAIIEGPGLGRETSEASQQSDETGQANNMGPPTPVAIAISAELTSPNDTNLETLGLPANRSQLIRQYIPISEQRLKTTFGIAGKVNTAAAMLPQAILAGLLAFSLMQGWGNEVAGIAALILGVAAFLGKYKLIEYLGRQNYVGWLDKPPSTWKALLPSTPAGIVQTLFTVNAALMFGYLSYLSCASVDGLGPLLRDRFEADATAATVESPIVWVPFGTASVIANLLSFPIIHSLGIGALKDIFNHLLSTVRDEREFLIAEAKMRYGINQVTMEWQKLVKHYRENNSSPIDCDRLIKILTTINGSGPNPDANQVEQVSELITEIRAKTSAELIAGFQAVADADGYDPSERISVSPSKATSFLALGVAALTAWGFSNFYDIAADMGHDLSVWFGADETSANIVGNYVTGPMGMTSMAIMAVLTAGFGTWIGERLFGKEQKHIYPNTSTKAWQAELYIEATVVCLLGGMPNVFQALFAAQPLTDVILSEIASFNMELFGYLESRYDGRESRFLKKAVKTDPLIKEIMDLVQSMKYSNVTHPGPTAVLTCIKKCREKIQSGRNRASENRGGELALVLLHHEDSPAATAHPHS